MKIVRLLATLANSISWVTIIIVIPSFAKISIAFKTSDVNSGSNADVISSKRTSLGFIARDRIIATLCF